VVEVEAINYNRTPVYPGQLSLAIPPWEISTGQRAVMLCGWGVKAGIIIIIIIIIESFKVAQV